MTLDPEWRQHLVELLLPLSRRWRGAAGAAFEELGVTLAVAAPILTVARLGDGVRQNVVADEVGVDAAALVRTVDVLEKSGLMERRVDPKDRRAKTLHLTTEGRTMAARLLAVYEPFRDSIVSGVSEADGATAIRVLRAIDAATREKTNARF